MIYFVYQSLLFSGLLLYTNRRIHQHGVPFRIAWDLAFVIMVFGFIGGRLLHVVFESPEVYQNDWIRIFRFWEGGFVFYGGFFFAFIASFVVLALQKQRPLPWLDFFAPVLAIGYSFGRIGCFLAGCCYGDFCDAPWAVQQRHPTQLYAFATDLLLFLVLIRQEKKQLPAGRIFSYWLMGHSVGRLLMESYRADFRGGTYFGYSLSSWISVGLFVLGALLFVATQLRRKQQ